MIKRGRLKRMSKVAFVLITLGLLVIVVYFARVFFTTSGIPLPFRVATGIVGLGLTLLLGVTGWGRYREARKGDSSLPQNPLEPVS